MAVVYITAYTMYLYWRVTIFNAEYAALSGIYLLAEIIGFVLVLGLIITSWDYSDPDVPAAPVSQPSLDVFVPVYMEPLSIIRATLGAARDIAYPHQTFVLDDGKRDDIQTLAQELGITYLRRDDHLHAKAGNLNHALRHSRAEFILVFDADHVALPDAATRLLPYFDRDSVALVQTPQDYYNRDAFPYMRMAQGQIWHDHAFFFHLTQTCGQAINASTCVGTGVCYRRSALNEIGGFPTETVTEDFHTSLKLHKAGYETVYKDEPVAYGLDAVDFREYCKTRHRWLHGNLHALAIERIWTCTGLSLRQKIHYICLGLIFLEGWQSLLLSVVPIIALATGMQPFVITVGNVLGVLLFPFLSVPAIRILGQGYVRFWPGEIFAMARWPFYIRATTALFGKGMKWRSSRKEGRGDIGIRYLWPQAAVCMLGLLSLGWGVFSLQGNYEAGPVFQFIGSILTGHMPSIDLNMALPKGYTVDLVAIAGAWIAYNTARFVFLAAKIWHASRVAC